MGKRKTTAEATCLTDGERHDARKRRQKARDAAYWKNVNREGEMPGWKRAIIETVTRISEDLRVITKETLEYADEERRKELMSGLQRIRGAARDLRLRAKG